MRGYVRRFAVYMQLRTRVIDDDVAAFAATGGRQLVSPRRWVRLPRVAPGRPGWRDGVRGRPPRDAGEEAVDHGGEIAPARVVFVPWDFEHEPLSALPARLKSEGHDDRARTMTILEGVVMYLTAPALDATFACIASYSAPGSPLAMTYMDRELIDRRSTASLLGTPRCASSASPFAPPSTPPSLPGWLDARGFRCERDESAGQAGTRLSGLTPSRARALRTTLSHFALARRV